MVEYRLLLFLATGQVLNNFQRLMEMALIGLQWTSCLIYLDDVIILGSNFGENTCRIRDVLERMRKANFKLRPENVIYSRRKLNFLVTLYLEMKFDPIHIW